MRRRWFSGGAAAHVRQQIRQNKPLAVPQGDTSKQFGDAYKLSDKVKRLGATNQLELAETEVKKASKETANVVVWNELIRQTLNARKYRRAWELWMDMKRRGIRPTSRSYVTFFSALAKVRTIEDGDSGLGRIKTVHAQWLVDAQRKLEAKRSPTDPNDSVSNIPTNAYLAFLASTDNIELMMSTFEAMPRFGPLAPNARTYATLFGALLKHIHDDDQRWHQAQDAYERLQRERITIDPLLSSLLVSLYRNAPRPDDQLHGLELAETFYGLLSPSKMDQLVTKQVPKPQVAMDSAAFSNVLTLCLKLQKLDRAIAYFDQVRDYPSRFGPKVLDYRHCDLVLAAHAYKHNSAGAQDLISWMLSQRSSLRPRASSFEAALLACQRASDLSGSKRMFDLMLEQNLKPAARVLHSMFSTALDTKDRGEALKAVELAENNGFEPDSFPGGLAKIKVDEQPSHEHKWSVRLATSIRLAIDRILSARNSPLDPARANELTKWREELDAWLSGNLGESKSARPDADQRPQRRPRENDDRPSLGARHETSFRQRGGFTRAPRETLFDRLMQDTQPSRGRRDSLTARDQAQRNRRPAHL